MRYFDNFFKLDYFDNIFSDLKQYLKMCLRLGSKILLSTKFQHGK